MGFTAQRVGAQRIAADDLQGDETVNETPPAIGSIPDAPLCPLCAGTMGRRVNKRGNPFWGCDRWPACDGLIDIQETAAGDDSVSEDVAADGAAGRWRRETAKELLIAIIGNWHNLPQVTDATVKAREMTDDLLMELRKGSGDGPQ